MNQVTNFVKQNVDARLMTTLIATSVVGGALYMAAMKSGIKPIKDVAKAAK